jgi:hypothetical protein
MRHFKDTVTEKVWSFDDDVVVSQSDGIYVFATKDSIPVNAPATLRPYTPPAPPAPTPRPDVGGFIDALKTAMGGIVGANALAKAYPLFYPALQTGNWADVQALLADAHATGALTEAQYAAFKTLAATHNIPVEPV